MKTPWEANTERLNCKIRADIKAALQGLAAKRHRAEGGYVGLTRVINEASLLLLQREGITLADPSEEAPSLPVRKPAKSDARRRRAVLAVRA
jgi:uncharacterized protein (DUF1778 family)